MHPGQHRREPAAARDQGADDIEGRREEGRRQGPRQGEAEEHAVMDACQAAPAHRRVRVQGLQGRQVLRLLQGEESAGHGR